MRIQIKRATMPEPTRKETSEQLECQVKRFTMSVGIKRNDNVEAEEVKQGDEVVDYKNVTIKGYLSTWGQKGVEDRDGEWIMHGAFTKSLPRFLRNPVLLRDHRNHTDSIAGKFTKIVEDEKGLFVEATISNAPGLKDLRFHLAEGNLKTLSIGGAFRFKDQSSEAVEEVELFEGTLTPVPANPEAVFAVSDLSPRGKAFMRDGGTMAGLKSVELDEFPKA